MDSPSKRGGWVDISYICLANGVGGVTINNKYKKTRQSESAKFTAFYAFPLVESIELLVSYTC